MSLAEIEAELPKLSAEELARVAALSQELSSRRRKRPTEEELQQMYQKIGIVPFPKRGGGPITTEFIRQLRDEEGI